MVTSKIPNLADLMVQELLQRLALLWFAKGEMAIFEISLYCGIV
jgi:hypothetical protein